MKTQNKYQQRKIVQFTGKDSGGGNGFYKEVECKEADHPKYIMSLIICTIQFSSNYCYWPSS